VLVAVAAPGREHLERARDRDGDLLLEVVVHPVRQQPGHLAGAPFAADDEARLRRDARVAARQSLQVFVVEAQQRELAIDELDHGGIDVRDGETLIAEAKPRELEIDVPEPVGVEEARTAKAGYRGTAEGEFGHCFVCGIARDDSFGVTAGPVEGRDVVATTWTPDGRTDVDGSGRVAPEFVWAVLDCPTYFALYTDSLPLSFLARFTARVDDLPEVGGEYVVIAWPIAKDGRKHLAGSAVLDASGNALAVAEALLIEARAD